MKEQEIRKNFANNLIYYRKASSMTQLELATQLNYSDKAVSKWERGESLPDVYTLTEIARIVGVTPNDLLSERIRTVKHPKDIQAKIIISLLSIAIVWIVATLSYVVLKICLNDASTFNEWLCFIYAIPASAIILIVFTAIWKNTLATVLSSSLCLWSIALSIHLSIKNLASIDKIWMIYFICIPIQILFILWFFLRFNKKRRKQKARSRFFDFMNSKKESNQE